MKRSLGYLGPAGTFTEEAALRYSRNRSLLLKPYPSIPEVMGAVESGEVNEGIVPVENSLEGTVTLTLDLFSGESPLQIKGELCLGISHLLAAPPGQKLSDIKEVHSHPQALAQCRRFLKSALPAAVPISAPSTAAAAKLVSTKRGASAAIASRHAASFYGLEVLKDEIQDHEPGGNMTRFLILALTDSPPTGDDKSSLITGLEDRPGSLHAALGIFARYQINMTKIESRPIRGQLGKFLFFIDIQGHRQDKHIARALKELRAESLFVKLLGSYPRTKMFE